MDTAEKIRSFLAAIQVASDAEPLLDDFRRWAVGLPNPSAQVADLLRSLAVTREWGFGALLLAVAHSHPDPAYVEPLCAILDLQDDFAPNEQVVDLLAVLRHSDAVPSLTRALHSGLPSDTFRHLQLKCIGALAEVGTPDAISVLQNIATATTGELADEARLVLSELAGLAR